MELDLRPFSPAQMHAQAHRAFRDLDLGEELVLVGASDSPEIRRQLEKDFAGSFLWEELESGSAWARVRLVKTARTPLPQVLGNTDELVAAARSGSAGAGAEVRWKIDLAERDLDSNLVALAPDAEISAHAGPSIDVMMIIVGGHGTVTTGAAGVPVRSGDIVWLPKHAQRGVRAGSAGLRYLTVHTHKTGLQIGRAREI